MVRDQLFIAEGNASPKNYGTDLIEAHREPRVTAAHQQPIDAGGMDHRSQAGIFHTANSPALEIKDRHGHEFREIKIIVRHRKGPKRQTARAPDRDGYRLWSRVRSTRLSDAC